eukprot:4037990-Prymnesium_polylepis.1
MARVRDARTTRAGSHMGVCVTGRRDVARGDADGATPRTRTRTPAARAISCRVRGGCACSPTLKVLNETGRAVRVLAQDVEAAPVMCCLAVVAAAGRLEVQSQGTEACQRAAARVGAGRRCDHSGRLDLSARSRTGRS